MTSKERTPALPLSDRGALLEQQLADRVLCLDGATGTWFQGCDLTAEDFGGEDFDGCNEHLVLTRPDLVLDMHRGYLEAGADIVETNSFGSTDIVLAEYPPLQDQAAEISRRAAQLARQACDELTSSDRPRFVAGSMGPTTKAITVTGGVTFEQLVKSFGDQARALLEGGADYLLIETSQDTRNVKAGLLAVFDLEQERGERIPVAVSGTIEPMGTMLAGQPAEALAVSVAHSDLLYLGLNCATGPEFMTDHIRALSELSRTRVACVPNAGLPDEDGNYLETPAMVCQVLGRFLDEGWLNLVGGCCGTTVDHVRALSELVAGARPRVVPEHHRALYSGIDWVESTEDNRPLLVGERTNVIGSRKFKRLIQAEKFEEASEVARAQVRGGAQITDVCLADPDREEITDMEQFLDQLIRKVKVPLMIDTTSAEVLERALTWCQGKAIINSINLEDGEERFESVVPLARRFGAALVVGCIDEDPDQGMAVTRARKLEVAHRSYDLLTGKYGVRPEDIIFDPLVFPCATGDASYVGSARETVEGLRLIKQELPLTRTVLGISNVSFGLPPAGREVVNSVFLYECTKAGLDMAIVNTEKLERYAQIPGDELRMAEAVLFETSDETIAELADHFRDAPPRTMVEASKLSLDERLAAYVVTGSKQGLVADLDTKLQEAAALDIVNGPLMAGMDEVGRLFNDNQLIVAEVLQSAEAMKAAVTHLEPYMEKSAASTRGKVLLATVKGDVHDIGKNLVEIVLANNGYEVINLGIKVPPLQIIEAVRRHAPDLLGLSGLLVKSAQMMVVSAKDMTSAGVTPDLLVGGAALTRRFTHLRIAPEYAGNVLYASDAMQGLALCNKLRSDADREGLLDQVSEERKALQASAEAAKPAAQAAAVAAAEVREVAEVPVPPDHDRHVLRDIPLDQVWPWVNPRMLYGKHLGFRGDFGGALKAGEEQAVRIGSVVDELRAEARDGLLLGQAVWRWLPADGSGDVLRLWLPDATDPAVCWTLPRQRGSGLSLPDFVRSASQGESRDHVALFVVTMGGGVRDRAEALKQQGAYLKCHALQALAIEAAEGLAEWLHARLRGQWGFPDPADMTMIQRYKVRYQGCRYSPGYPACPDLSMQEGFWKLLEPQEIGVELSDGQMMDPEASVSALVLHHPEARYFNAS